MEKEISYYEKLAKEDLILLLIEQRGLKLDYDYQHFRFVIAKIDGVSIGTTRCVGDGGYHFFLCDVIVHRDFQRLGIGSMLINKFLQFVDDTVEEGETAWKDILRGFYGGFAENLAGKRPGIITNIKVYGNIVQFPYCHPVILKKMQERALCIDKGICQRLFRCPRIRGPRHRPPSP